MSCLECTDCLSIGTFDICCETLTLAQADPTTAYKVVITDVTLDSKTTYNPDLQLRPLIRGLLS